MNEYKQYTLQVHIIYIEQITHLFIIEYFRNAKLHSSFYSLWLLYFKRYVNFMITSVVTTNRQSGLYTFILLQTSHGETILQCHNEIKTI